MHVQRIHTAIGSHVEPPLDQTWSQIQKLRWHAAVVEVDNDFQGIEISKAHLSRRIMGRWVRVPDVYEIAVGSGGGSGAYTFSQAWDYLNGVSAGMRAMRQQVASR